MKYDFSWTAFSVFAFFVGIVLGLSFYLGRKAKSAKGYYAAHGQINWFVNGIAFAGDYLSAASFLGICGMIAFFGYDGFLYSIGYLAGWVVALFVIAEPLKRMGKFTFADALDAKFNSPGIKLAAAISTLLVSLFYLIPQMVGAGVLIQPLLGFSHETGVITVGIVVILIVATAGMVSTTWVQFIKGSLLVIFCLGLTVSILNRGLKVSPTPTQPQVVTKKDGKTFVDGKPQGHGEGQADLKFVGTVAALPDGKTETGPLGPLEYIATIQKSQIVTWTSAKTTAPDGAEVTTYKPVVRSGEDLLQPGGTPTFKGIRSEKLSDKLDFISLMLALFCGTASLPHILIRYYTVKDGNAARKSTVVGIASIGFFYVLTLFLGLGAMTSNGMDPTNNNMAAPLLAKTFGELQFAIISAIAFTTVLGTVSGLIMAASGAVAHDLMTNFLGIKLDDHGKVKAGKIAAVVVGAIAMVLGIVFQKLNVSFLVGWAFNIAASANLPALVMLLFWKRTTKQGITWAIIIGLVSSLAWVLMSGQAYKDVYGWDPATAIVPFSQPGLVTIPLGFLVLVVVSLLSPPPEADVRYAKKDGLATA
ncbi:sodium/solute symporter [Humisphaera borealis]|uniref:Cation acetate symporter n=1 Tax=Humisphaera borealis TaxID=2807512 RepID=A0A7M2WY73_9BACT|nr:cation acetate symporter [Humisphaera borealis]QOV90425.1 cation acetate symporter [Humisphaera borealis]